MRQLTGGSSAAAGTLLVFGLLAASQDSLASLQETGQWEPSAIELGAQATHMGVLRGDGDSTKIVYWHRGQVDARMWDPSDASSARSFPSPNHVFCAGHSILSDGRLLVTGGTEVGTVGLRPSTLFNPRRSEWAGLVPWRSGPSSTHGRWYPTNVTLGNGKVWTFSGSKYAHFIAYGGNNGTSAQSAVTPLTMTLTPAWKSAVAGMPERENHSAIQWSSKQSTIVFGGRSGSTLYNEVWKLQYSRYDNQSEDVWSVLQLSPGYDPALGSTLGYPAARENHGAIIDPKESVMFIYGGRNASGSALADLWMLDLDATPLQWKRLAEAADAGERYGHTCVYDRGTTDATRRMLVFGGATSSTQLATTSVWALSLQGPTYSWSTLTLKLGSPVPDARYGHATSFDDFTRRHGPPAANTRRMLLVGGRQDESSVIESDAIWNLWIPDDGSAPYWQSVTPATPRPGRRANAALAFDGNSDQFVLTGGERPSTIYDDTWALRRLDPCDGSALCDVDPYWVEVANSAGPGSRKGATAVVEPNAVFARIPEEFSSSGSGSWTELGTGHRKWQLLYPFMHLLPSGYLFESGPTNPQLLDPQSSWIGTEYDAGFIGGSSVMFAPNKVMKCGGPGGAEASNLTKHIEFSGIPPTTSGWQAASVMSFRRQDHNLTMLPNGKVLATGGVRVDDDITTAVKRPEIWDPASQTWDSAVLPEDPSARGYHAVAVLLPDARVMTAGGDASGDYRNRGTIYSPGYLFTGDVLAQRPVISAAADSVVWGHPFSVTTPQADGIASAALVRPSAVTHSFDQDQRFIPLTIRVNQAGQDLILDGPVGENWAPPGNYMLFLVDTSGVPSIASWVRVLGQAEDGLCTDVTPAPISWSAPDVGRNTMVLTWQAPGGNGQCGTGHEFDVRRSTAVITEGNFYAATKVPMEDVTPGVAGTEHCKEISGLASCTTYHFAIKTRDAQGAWSKVSNSVSAQTLCSSWAQALCEGGGLLAGGGGEGGGSLRQTLELNRAGGEPITSGEESGNENSILWATDDGPVMDLRRMGSLTADGEGHYTIQLRQAGTWKTNLDHVALGFVDHGVDEVAIAGWDRVLVGTLGALARVTDGEDSAVAGLSGTDVQPRDLRAGEHLTAHMNGATANTALVIESSGRAPRAGEGLGGILVQIPDAQGGWTTVGEVQPRRQFDRRAVMVGQSGSVRLVFPRTCIVRSLAQLEVSRRTFPEPLELLSAAKSGSEWVAQALQQRGGDLVLVDPGDSLVVSFATSQGEAQGVRDLFLLARGSMERTQEQATSESARLLSDVHAAHVNSLGQARPNPSAGEVTIDFTLAQRSPVSFRIYDVSGRLVRSLVNEELAEGPQTVLWDGRTDVGLRVGAGVFLYRIVAGGWHSERKLIVLQP